MAKFSRERFKDALYDAGVDVDEDEDVLREDYSGRGMYGSTCTGIVVTNVSQAFAFVAALVGNRESEEEDLSWVGNVSTDSMGLDMIVYWPGLTLVDDE